MLTDASLTFLTALLDAPGPSGFEAAPARRWRTEAEGFADEVWADVNGNSLAALRVGAAGAPPVMFAGPVPGVIGKPAIHMLEKEDREKVSKTGDLWIDIGAAAKAEASARIRVGDPGVLAGGMQELPNGRLVSRSLDNRVGAFVVLEALRRLAAQRPPVPVTAVATAQEEISLTGGGARTSATGLLPLVAVVVDVTHATDTPKVEKQKHGDVALGGGPVLSRGSAVNGRVFELLVEAAEAEGIPYSIHAAARDTGTDADSIFTAHRGVATGLVSVPLRYMHSPNELVALEDLDRAARLLAAFARRLTPGADFVPR